MTVSGFDSLRTQYDANEEVLDSGYNRALKLYGHIDTFNIDCASLPKYLYRQYMFGHSVPVGESLSWYSANKAKFAAETTRSIRSAVGILKDQYGLDVLFVRNFSDKQNEVKKTITDLSERTNIPVSGSRVVEPEDMGDIFALSILRLFTSDKNVYRRGIANSIAMQHANPENIQVLGQMQSQISFYSKVIKNPAQMRTEAQRQLRELMGDDITAFIDYAEQFFTQASREDLIY